MRYLFQKVVESFGEGMICINFLLGLQYEESVDVAIIVVVHFKGRFKCCILEEELKSEGDSGSIVKISLNDDITEADLGGRRSSCLRRSSNWSS